MKLRTDERGVAAVEFAIVSLLLMMLIYGIITFGFVFALDHNMAHAAGEGARSAILKSNTTATQVQIETFAEDTTRQRLTFQSAKDNAVIDATIAACANDPAVDCITVTVDYDWATHPIVPPLLGVAGVVSDLHSTAVVQLD